MLGRIRTGRGSESGFTLVELLIVIVILGALAGIVVFSVSGITDRGDDAACKSNKKTVQVAQEAYYAKNDAYAASVAALVTADFLASPAPTGISTDTTGAVTAADC